MWYLIVAAALTANSSPEVTVSRLDGSTISGRLSDWHDETLELTTNRGIEQIPTAELQSIRFGPPVESDSLPPVIIASDGSVIPIQSFKASNGRVVVTPNLSTGSSDAPDLRCRLRLIRAVRLRKLGAAVADQWQEILDIEAPSDLIILVKRGGKSLDYMEGVVGNVTDEAVEFTLDDMRVDVPRAKVAGVVYYRRSKNSKESPRVLTGSDDLRLVAKSVRLAGNTLHVETMAGIEVDWPLNRIQLADFSAGKIIYLSDLRPAAQSWQPIVGLPAAASNIAETGRPRFDRSASGGTLSLSYPGESLSDDSGRVQLFERGIAIRSRTELVYRLPRGFDRFVAEAGIEPNVRETGNVVLSIYGDERPLFEAAVSGQDAPLSIDVDISTVRRLRIVADFGDNLDTGDWLNLCSARIIK